MTTELASTPKWMLWTGRVLSAVPALMVIMLVVILITSPQQITEGMQKQYGYPATAVKVLPVVEVICVLLYYIPMTNVLGAILLTAYMGGAVATHVRAGEPQWFVPVIVGAIVWLGLYLRDPKVRAMVPFRKS